MEFQVIYNIRDKMKPIFACHGIKYTELKPPNPFLYDMLKRPVYSKRKGNHFGYGWCGGVCRWGTTMKQNTIDKYVCDVDKHYIGIAADEVNRLERLVLPKCSPLADAGMTESDCLAFCREQGFNWNEPTAKTPSGNIDLYDILDRVSCWCCRNKNRKELKNIYIYLPDYWDKLKSLQMQIKRPMKKWCDKINGTYGNVFDAERVFQNEIENNKTKNIIIGGTYE